MPLRRVRPARLRAHVPARVLLVAALLACGGDNGTGPTPPVAGSLRIVSGDTQTGAAGTALGAPLIVKVTTGNGLPVPGATVRFQATSGGGRLASAMVLTDTAGLARDQWTLGQQVADSEVATAAALDAQGQVVAQAVFHATAVAGAPATLTRVAGDAQTGAAGGALPDSLVVKVADQYGNAVGGAMVRFAAAAGAGTVSPDSARTDARGLAATAVTLAARLGAPDSVSATVGSLAPAVFTATSGAPAGAQVATAGAGQSAAIGAALATPLAVGVTTASGAPLAGVPVQWTVSSGTLSNAMAATGADGRATATWTLGTTVGAQHATATVLGTAHDFTATAATPPSGGLVLAAVGGAGQTGTVGAALADSLAVRATLADGRPVSGQTISWAASMGSGGDVGAAFSPSSSVTGADGIARAQLTLGHVAGARTAIAIVPGMTSALFAEAGTAGAARTIALVSGDAQRAGGGQAEAQPVVVQARDAYGNVVSGATVTWAVAAGGGSVTPASSLTDSTGSASARWTLGSSGTQQLTAALGSSSVSFTATVEAAGFTIVSGNGATVQAGTAQQLQVSLLDASGAAVSGATVTWAVVGGGGRLSGASGPAYAPFISTFSTPAVSTTSLTMTTNAQGAAATYWYPGGTLGTQQLVAVATVNGAADTLHFTANVTAGPSCGPIKVTGTIAGPTGTTIFPLAVGTTDYFGNATPDILPPVGLWSGFTPQGGTATDEGTVSVETHPDANGQPVTGLAWHLGAAVGTQTQMYTFKFCGDIRSQYGLLTATTTDGGAVGAPYNLILVGGDSQTVAVGNSFAQPLVAKVTDQWGHPVAGVTMVWQSTALGTVTVTTDANGLTAVTLHALAAPGEDDVTVAPSGQWPSAPGPGLPRIQFREYTTSP